MKHKVEVLKNVQTALFHVESEWTNAVELQVYKETP